MYREQEVSLGSDHQHIRTQAPRPSVAWGTRTRNREWGVPELDLH